MIKSFKSKALAAFYNDGCEKYIKPEHRQRVQTILFMLNNAMALKDINFPGANLHPLKGKRKGFYSVSISGNWRIIFKFDDTDAYEVDYLDYH